MFKSFNFFINFKVNFKNVTTNENVLRTVVVCLIIIKHFAQIPSSVVLK